MATTRLYAPRPYDEFDSGVAGVAPILSTGTDVDNTKVTAVQAAATASGIGTLPTSAGGTAPAPVAEPLRFRGPWQINTVYSYGDVVSQGGSLYVAPSAFTSGSSFVAGNWTRLGPYDATDPSFSTTYESLGTALLNNGGRTANVTVDLSRATTTPSGSALSIHTGIGTGDDIVEPAVLFDASAPFLGYEYVLCAAPYYTSNAIYENPTLWVSHDGSTWVPVVNGVPTPGGTPTVLAAAGVQGDGNNSDPWLGRGPDGTYYVLWNQFLNATGSGGTGTGGNNWAVKGISASSLAGPWTAPVTLLATVLAATRPSTPSMFWDGTTWQMYAVDTANSSSTLITRYTNPSANPLTGAWTQQANPAISTPPYTGQVWWHLNAYRWGSRHVLLVQDNAAGTSGGGNLWLVWSDDGGTTWTMQDDPVFAGGSAGYRGALVFGTGGALDLFYGILGANWQLFRTPVTLAAPGRSYGGITPVGLPYIAAAVSAAMKPIAPYVLGDSCVRADNAATPGSADSGQAWVVDAGVPGISGNAVYASTAVNTKAHVALTGCADGVFTAEFAVVSSAQQQYLTVRNVDTNNYVRFGNTGGGGYTLQNIVAGAVSQTVTPPTPLAKNLANGDQIVLVCHGSTIRCYVNGIAVIKVSNFAANASASGIGFQFSNTAPRTRSFSARPLVGAA